MLISSIAAVAENQVIGAGNDLIWRLPVDMRWFRDCTTGHCVIMGRKNWESMPKALPNRTNIVVTRNHDYEIEGGIVVHSLEEALDYAHEQGEEEAFIIGGGQIYSLSQPLWDKLYYTHVFASPEGDAYFPEVDWEMWDEIQRTEHPIDERHAHAFAMTVYEKRP